jgi:flagellar biosynthesis/type III secretory pathway ATPase
MLAGYERQRDLVALGAYRRGADPAADAALDRLPAIESFLRQGMGEAEPFPRIVARLLEIVA